MTDAEHQNTVAAATPGASPAFAWMAAAFTLFIIYGSLVPFDYEVTTQTEALAKLRAMLRQPIGPDTSSDWAANVLLFVPFAFFLAGSFKTGHRWSDLIKAVLPIFGLAFLLGGAVEYAQIYFPPRNPSLNDLLAQSVGTGLGLCAWKFWGQALGLWLDRPSAQQGGGYRSVFFAYIAVLVIYSAFPLDLSMSMAEIYRKLRAGKIVLLPFSYTGKAGAELLYDLLTDVLIWVPPAVLAWRAFGWTSFQVFVRLIAMAIGIELMQVFILSRIADLTDVVLAGAGVFAGLRIGSRFAPRSGENKLSLHVAGSAWLPVASGLLWAVVVMLVFWYPYNFVLDADLLARRWQAVSKLPFIAYFASTEYRALTEALHKSIFFAPFGFALAWIGRSRKRLFVLSGVMVLFFACGIETGKLVLPGRSPDLGNIIVEMLGAFMGYILLSRRMHRFALSSTSPRWRWHTEIAVLLAASLTLVLGLLWPSAPAFFHEALESPLLLSLAVLLLWFYALARLPLLTFFVERSARQLAAVSALYFLSAFLGAALLDMVFTSTALINSAIWQAVLLWAVAGGGLGVARAAKAVQRPHLTSILWFVSIPFLFGALYWNFEGLSWENGEALHSSKAWTAFTSMLALSLIGAAPAFVSYRVASKGAHAIFAGVLVWLFLIVVSFFIMRAGLAEALIIEGRVYTGLEYFLSSGPQYALSPSALLLRYVLICGCATAVIGLLQYPMWRRRFSVQIPSGRYK